MALHHNDLYIITKDSLRYKSLYKQYILLLDSLERLDKKQDLTTIKNFLIYLTLHTNIRKIHRVEKKHLILFAREEIHRSKDQSSEEIFRELIKSLTIIKSLHNFNIDVSLKNFTFWCEVLK
ncbi:hypothetical protein FS935_01545 [Metabacillus litoralis]|uniref:Uncharacterized protein n=1 Tax=Metabacillus litoralis TaxID=152268 RepID=A0A5C6W676_9BACI|nr:hypothetical protein [Metabacillus litoralis]TXC92904.1 hypothetical protein FS935_01545 [Metabacillus litoralis]